MKKRNIELTNDPRSQKIIEEISNYLYKQIVCSIEIEFHNIETFLNFRTNFGIYAKKAQSRSLTPEEATKFAKMRIRYNKTFGIDFETFRKLNKQFRYKGKITRLTAVDIDYVLSTRYKLKAINKGKSFSTNYHWTKKYVAESAAMYKYLWKRYHKEQFSVLTNHNTIDDSIDDLIEGIEL